MSYDVDFCDPVSKKVIELDEPHFMRGGTYAIGGTKELTLNITYNYSENYSKHNFSINDLDEKTAIDVIPELEHVISELGDEVDPDYWKPTDGNAKKALIQLLTMCRMRPDAVISIS